MDDIRQALAPLRLATQDLHHAAERHPVGASMADGTMRPDWWADWINALLTIHLSLDHHLAPTLRRCTELYTDLATVSLFEGVKPRISRAAWEFAAGLDRRCNVAGAAYVFTGAHLMGGAITERMIGKRLPCEHLRWPDRAAALADWKPWRAQGDVEGEARAAFACVLAILDEILHNHPLHPASLPGPTICPTLRS